MGKIVKKKKKGRPSLLDLQKRSLKQHQKPQFGNRKIPISTSYNSATPTSSLRQSSRRNPAQSEQDDDDDEDSGGGQLNGNRREKKLQLVLKLPSHQKLNPDSASDDDEASVPHRRKRKINAISGGSGFGATEKRDKSVSGANPTNNAQDRGPSTPLPDKKLLLFILDMLQKKDTHGVFSEPVDPDELPDYHEVIAHPMDFGTVRKKVSSGAYATLEQFEKDVYLISSNAMEYNAPDTVYFRQARSIHELAKKSFQNLRQDSDDNEPEPERKPEPEPKPEPEVKVVRRGRPPKNLQKPLGRPSLNQGQANSNLISGRESTLWSNYDIRRGPIGSDKSSFADLSGQSHGSRASAHWLAENKFEKNIEGTGSIFKGSSFKYGKKQYVIDENRRDTYKQFSGGGREPPVLATFDAERKQLVALGLVSEHGYARSLARFAANIGTVAWKIASARIERSLPPGVNYGHGWVGENDIPPQRPMIFSPSPPENSCNPATSSIAESNEHLSKNPKNISNENGDGILTTQPAAEGQQSSQRSPSASTSSYHFGPPNQVHQTGINGFSGPYGFHVPAHTGYLKPSDNSKDALPNSENEEVGPSRSSWHGPLPQARLAAVPPDLNVIFQSPGSPGSNRVGLGQPDLALQL